MHTQRAFPLPPHTEDALGYGSQGTGLCVGVYRNRAGQAIWDDGVEEGIVEPRLLTIFAKLWGPLPSGYGYLLDRTKRLVHVLTTGGVQLFLENRDEQEVAGGWLTDAQAAAALVASLVSYAADPTDAEECLECFHGYIWMEGFQEFAPCAWCNPDTDR